MGSKRHDRKSITSHLSLSPYYFSSIHPVIALTPFPTIYHPLQIDALRAKANIQLHGRSRQQRYSKLADWAYIKSCATTLRESLSDAGLPKVPMFGNGDCFSAQQYYEEMEGAGVDGVMVARGALIKPWIFTEIKERREWDISATERLEGIRKVSHVFCFCVVFHSLIPSSSYLFPRLLVLPLWRELDGSGIPEPTPPSTLRTMNGPYDSLRPATHFTTLSTSPPPAYRLALTTSTPNTDSRTGVPTLKESIQPVDSS